MMHLKRNVTKIDIGEKIHKKEKSLKSSVQLENNQAEQQCQAKRKNANRVNRANT